MTARRALRHLASGLASGLATVLAAMLPAGLVWAVVGGSASAQALLPAPYQELLRALDGRLDFETLPRRAEPGVNLDAALRAPGVWLGERFAGQTLGGAPHDALVSDMPEAPLRLLPGAPGRNLSVAHHRGFGSNAVFPLGPAGWPEIAARGEGALAVLFDEDQAAFGFLLHGGYADALASGPRGRVVIRAYRRDGQLVAQLTEPLLTGVNAFGYRRAGGWPDVAGLLILNDDPGGVALDDLLFRLQVFTG